MPKYRVFVNEVIYNAGWVEVEAPTQEAAQELVEEGGYDEADLEPKHREVDVIDVESIPDVVA